MSKTCFSSTWLFSIEPLPPLYLRELWVSAARFMSIVTLIYSWRSCRDKDHRNPFRISHQNLHFLVQWQSSLMFSNEQMPGLPEDLSLSSKHVGPSIGLRAFWFAEWGALLADESRKEDWFCQFGGAVAVCPVNKVSAPMRS